MEEEENYLNSTSPLKGWFSVALSPLTSLTWLLLRLLPGWGNVLLLAGYTIKYPFPTKERCRLHWLGRPITEV